MSSSSFLQAQQTILAPLFNLGFVLCDQSEFGATYRRRDGSEIVFATSRAGLSLSASLRKIENGSEKFYAGDLLMAAVDPGCYASGQEIWKRCDRGEGVGAWCQCFVEFLEKHRALILDGDINAEIAGKYESLKRERLRKTGFPESFG